jgi:hypothetical protein
LNNGGFFLQDEIGSHAAAGKILNPFIILAAVGVRIEVSGTLVTYIFQELDQEEARLSSLPHSCS